MRTAAHLTILATIGLVAAGIGTGIAAEPTRKKAPAEVAQTPTQPQPVGQTSTQAAAAPGVQIGRLSPQQRDTLQAINHYFNAVRTMAGAFVQFGPDGDKSEGQFYMARPGKIRFQYAKPSTLEIVADNLDVIVKDRKNQTQDLYPLSKTPLHYLLADQIDLTSEANVTKVSIEPDLVTVVVEQNTIFGDGKLTMVFDRKTFELRQWTVTDAQGYDTSVVIYNTVQNLSVDEKLFRIDRTPVLK